MTEQKRQAIIEAKKNLEDMAAALQTVLDGETTQSAIAAANGMIPTEISRNVSRKFVPYVRKQLAAVDGLPALVNGMMPAEDRLVTAVFGIDIPDDAVLVLPEIDYDAVDSVLGTLTPREEKTLRIRFGLHPDYGPAPKGLEFTAREFGVTCERIRQIEAKALRKLRHPTRSRKFFMNLPVRDEFMTEYARTALKEAETRLAAAIADYKDAEAADQAAGDLRRAAGMLRQGKADPGTDTLVREHLAKFDGPPALERIPIEELELSVRTYNCLKRRGIDTVGAIKDLGPDGLLQVRNLGRRGISEIERQFRRLTDRDLRPSDD